MLFLSFLLFLSLLLFASFFPICLQLCFSVIYICVYNTSDCFKAQLNCCVLQPAKLPPLLIHSSPLLSHPRLHSPVSRYPSSFYFPRPLYCSLALSLSPFVYFNLSSSRTQKMQSGKILFSLHLLCTHHSLVGKKRFFTRIFGFA